jgi:hypothetical protein
MKKLRNFIIHNKLLGVFLSLLGILATIYLGLMPVYHLPPMTQSQTIPNDDIPTLAMMQRLVSNAWYPDIPFNTIKSRIEEVYPNSQPHAEFKNGAKFLVVKVQEGYFFVTSANLEPWVP